MPAAFPDPLARVTNRCRIGATKKGRRSATPLLFLPSLSGRGLKAGQNAAVRVKTTVLPAMCEPFFDEEKLGCR